MFRTPKMQRNMINVCSNCSTLLICVSVSKVTYRVVQVTDQHIDGREDAGGAVSVVSTAAFAGAPQAVAQVTQPLFFS